MFLRINEAVQYPLPFTVCNSACEFTQSAGSGSILQIEMNCLSLCGVLDKNTERHNQTNKDVTHQLKTMYC